jgi:hypothetical protein
MSTRNRKAAIKSGRPSISPTGEAMKMRHVRMLDDDWEKCLALGGSAWVRARVREAPWPSARDRKS